MGLSSRLLCTLIPFPEQHSYYSKLMTSHSNHCHVLLTLHVQFQCCQLKGGEEAAKVGWGGGGEAELFDGIVL